MDNDVSLYSSSELFICTAIFYLRRLKRFEKITEMMQGSCSQLYSFFKRWYKIISFPSLRVFKFSRRLAQVTSYFKHLRRVLFVFQIYTILFHQTNRDLIFLRK